jgi:hypothetical protein
MIRSDVCEESVRYRSSVGRMRRLSVSYRLEPRACAQVAQQLFTSSSVCDGVTESFSGLEAFYEPKSGTEKRLIASGLLLDFLSGKRRP